MEALVTSKEIELLSIDERILLLEQLWESIVADQEKLEVTDAQRRVLDRRLAAHYAAPIDGISWEKLKERLLGRSDSVGRTFPSCADDGKESVGDAND